MSTANENGSVSRGMMGSGYRGENSGVEDMTMDVLQQRQAEVDQMRRQRMEHLEEQIAEKDKLIHDMGNEVMQLNR